MWLPPFLRPLRAVAFDTLLALTRALPGANLLESNNRPPDGIPVFVMMPLDFACESPRIAETEIENALSLLARSGVHGVMVDVWWGVCEPEPQKYDFALYGRLAETCKKLGLKMQATMSFHACGGNVGDSVNIPLPHWVVIAADKHDAWFRDRMEAIAQGTDRNREYLSFGTDHHAFLPSAIISETGPVSTGPADVQLENQGQLQQASTTVSDDSKKPEGKSSVVESETTGTPVLAEDEKGNDSVQLATASTTMETAAQTSNTQGDGQVRKLRTPMQAYTDFIEAFCTYMSSEGNDYLENVITELQIGVGPCGELRYPSYPMSNEKWEFPGIGEFQCYDPHLLTSLAQHAGEPATHIESRGARKWSVPPDGAGNYNDSPFATTFFTKEFKSDYGKFFQEWYSRVLLRHCDDVLNNVRRIVRKGESSVALAVKICGIHWWHFTTSRAAEATAGYYVSHDFNFYQEVAKLFKKHSVVFDFTCLEMKTFKQPFLKARSGPKQLVREVFRAAAREDVMVAGENALERYDWEAYAQIIRAFKWTNALAHGFTLLRLTPALLEEEHLQNLERLTLEMRALKQRRA